MLSARVERSTPCGLLGSAPQLESSFDGSPAVDSLDDLLRNRCHTNRDWHSCRSVSAGSFQLHRDRVGLSPADSISFVARTSTAPVPAHQPVRGLCLSRLV